MLAGRDNTDDLVGQGVQFVQPGAFLAPLAGNVKAGGTRQAMVLALGTDCKGHHPPDIGGFALVAVGFIDWAFVRATGQVIVLVAGDVSLDLGLAGPQAAFVLATAGDNSLRDFAFFGGQMVKADGRHLTGHWVIPFWC